MRERAVTLCECPVCHQPVRASRHTEEECRLTRERDEARRLLYQARTERDEAQAVGRRLWQAWQYGLEASESYRLAQDLKTRYPWLTREER